MPLYGTQSPTSLSPGDFAYLLNGESIPLGANIRTVSFSRAVSMSGSDQGTTFLFRGTVTQNAGVIRIQYADLDLDANYVTAVSVPAFNGGNAGTFVTDLSRARFYRCILNLTNADSALTIVAMR